MTQRHLAYMLIVCIVFVLSSCGGGENNNNNNNVVGGAPVVSIIVPTPAATYNAPTNSLTIGGTASDDTQVTQVTWVNNRGGSGTATGTTDWSAAGIILQDGVNEITVTASDPENRLGAAKITVNYTVVDNQAPSVYITAPSNNGAYTANANIVSLAGTATDNVEVKRIRYSNAANNQQGDGNIVGENWIVSTVNLVNGPNNITITAYDYYQGQQGNSATANITVTYEPNVGSESCMNCHNGSQNNDDYAGGGIENPHPFAGSQYIKCTKCHGGFGQPLVNGVQNAQGNYIGGKYGSHVPPPPQISGTAGQLDKAAFDAYLQNNNVNAAGSYAYFNRLTLTGLDQIPDYTVNGKTFSALDYLQFINPGDLRVVSQNKSCGSGGCHSGSHASWVSKSILYTEAGILSGATYAAGIDNAITAYRGLYEDTAADKGFRAVQNVNQVNLPSAHVGEINQVYQFPVYSDYNDLTFQQIVAANASVPGVGIYAANEFNGQRTNGIKANSDLAKLYHEQIAFTCGDCHLGSAGANNRAGDFRSSGCSACHMQYSIDGRSRSTDPNINTQEPANADQIAAPERSHARKHLIKNVSKVLPPDINGNARGRVNGIDDLACAGCHQGSNRTVMQYYGVRLDQNQDVVGQVQYPANTNNFINADVANVRIGGQLLYDANVNATFNGRVANQYLAYEDYDNDGRDDTPMDIHAEAGLGCIDCHGSRDLHGGAPGDASSGKIISRHEQSVAITCVNCHGSPDAYAITKPCYNYDNQSANCAVDRMGNALRHVNKIGNQYWLTSRVDGQTHFIPQTLDTIVNTQATNPDKGDQFVYNAKASYAMGRADGVDSNGIGPQQADPLKVTPGYSHTDRLDCVSCHATWTNNCMGCHLAGQLNNDPANFIFSNITGQRIVYEETTADFVYQNPMTFQLSVGPSGLITQSTPVEKVFYQYNDGNTTTGVLAFSDRKGNGNNPNVAGRGPLGALGHNHMMPHSIRGRVTNQNEGPRYCVACHNTQNGIDTYGALYAEFKAAMDAAAVPNNPDFTLLEALFANNTADLIAHFGTNTGNHLESPLWVHNVAGLGSGMYIFDANGCPLNPIDAFDGRKGCNNVAPATTFAATGFDTAKYNLDRVVEYGGISNASSNHPLTVPGQGAARGGALYPNMAGPLGAAKIQKLTDPNIGVVLDSWLDANGNPQGQAAQFLQQ